VKRKILNFFSRRGILLDKYVDEEDINSILRSLKPNHCGYELIRIGSPNDGGYLIPNVLNGITACFSPGVSTNSSFEWDMAELGIKCFLADYSVEAPPQRHSNFDFIKLYLDSICSSKTITLSRWIDRYNIAGDYILQMDIEGHEYAVLLSTSIELLTKFRIIVVEFHEFDSIVTEIGSLTFKHTLKHLLQNHTIVHVHPNNLGHPRKFQDKSLPRAIEVTFLRNDYVLKTTSVSNFPNILDQPNSLEFPDIILDEAWFS
jgi:hypothetical protein